MSLFQLGDFRLSSGRLSRWKIDCDALAGADIAALAQLIRLLAGPFSSVEGVPTGGDRLADALRPLAVLDGPHLIVDDVLTTGASMERHKSLAMKGGVRLGWVREDDRVKGAVVFARGQCPLWVRALFQMPEAFWPEPGEVPAP